MHAGLKTNTKTNSFSPCGRRPRTTTGERQGKCANDRILDIATSSTPFDTPNCRRRGSKIFDGIARSRYTRLAQLPIGTTAKVEEFRDEISLLQMIIVTNNDRRVIKNENADKWRPGHAQTMEA
jgi:hypothetical protein